MNTAKNPQLFHLLSAGCKVQLEERQGHVLLIVYGPVGQVLYDGPINNTRNVVRSAKQAALTRALNKCKRKLDDQT